MFFVKDYYKRLVRIALRDPLKIPTMVRLKVTKTSEWKQDFTKPGARISPPLIVSIRLNYACNLRCVMCNQWGENGIFIKEPDKMVKRDMTTADWKALLDQVAPFRPYVTFIGGEPLMNPDTLELIRYASSRHMLTSMTTNATFLKAKARDLVRAGLDYVHTSLDAPVAVETDAVRRDASDHDSYQQAVDGIRELIRVRDEMGVGLPIVQVQTVLVKENQHLLSDMARFMEELRPDVWSLQQCVFTTPEINEATTKVYKHFFGQVQSGWSGFIRDFKGMDFDGIRRQLKVILGRRWSFRLRIYKPVGQKGFSFERYYTEPKEYTSDEKLHCMHPYVFAQIQPNGDMVFCGEQPDYRVGNVREGKFLDTWVNERATKWRWFLQKRLFPACKRCYALHELDHFKKK